MIYRVFLAAFLAGLVTACTPSRTIDEGAAVEDRGTAVGEEDGGAARPYSAEDDVYGDISALADPELLSVRTIHFEYDSSEVQAQYRSVIEAHAAYLASNPDITVTLEGHADERGSREYNLALGERRSIAVKRQLGVLGAGTSQLRTTSYGEERPVSEEHNEYAWSQNRRVEIIY